MGFVEIGRVAWLEGDATQRHLLGISDMWIEQGAAGPMLYTISEAGQMLASFSLTGSAPRLIDRAAMPAGPALGVDTEVSLIEAGGKTLACVTGVAGRPAWLTATGDEGQIKGYGGDPFAALPDDAAQILVTDVGSQSYAYVLRPGSDSISAYRMAADGSYSAVYTPAPERPTSSGPGLSDLATLELHGKTWLAGASTDLDALVLFRVAGNGVPVETDRVWNLTGIGLDTPSAVVTAVVGGHGYAVMASSNTSSITVAEILADGTLKVTDHVLDSLNTRF
ncbi:hypothetical protein [Pseudoroseicyclus sp. CXY001]|uniref:hypothetical protein n=1 Tax=Pseudoroseicyclus sp. CXY001 TaxID=3242492 RepID=UPI0035709912